MLRVLGCLGGGHDWCLVILAVVVCLLASLVAVNLFHRARVARGRAQTTWIIVAGITTGCGVWATHFIAILAFKPEIPIAYDFGLTASSLIVAVAMTSAGLGIAVLGSARSAVPVGGVIVGSGVAGMHYLGIAALEVPGQAIWIPDLVLISIMTTSVLDAAALLVAMRGEGLGRTLIAAMLLMSATVSLHFIGLSAVRIAPDPMPVIYSFPSDQAWLAVEIAACAVGVLGASLIGAQGDRISAVHAMEAAARLRGLTEATTEAIAICENDVIIDVNTSLERLVGRRMDELCGLPLRCLFSDPNTIIPDLVDPIEVLVKGPDGRPVECEATTRAIPFRGRTSIVVSLRDLRERRRTESRMRHLALHDPLTDMPNRAFFNQHLEITLNRAQSTGKKVAVVCVDLDRFKDINDVFGHAVGDIVLQQMSQRFREVARDAFLARLGGDEFTFIVSDGPQPSTAEALAQRLQAIVSDDFECEGHHLRIGISVGIAVYPDDCADAVSLLINADAALYRAKAEGNSAVQLFEPKFAKQLRERRALQHDLLAVIARSELRLHYQPQALIGGEIIGFEALVRWHHPTRGLLAPASFISLAEESGSIVSIGEWTLREACREAASWPRPLQVAVNLSPIQFRHGDLPNLVHSILLETGLSPRRLELEITEGVLIGDFAGALSILRRLKSFGVRIAMDDFGAGYSSLSYLQAFPFDKIKIDQAFISNLEHKPQSAAIIRAVIGLGRGLDLPVVAEGVETEAQLAFLVSEACHEVQGYLVGRPYPIESYAELVGRCLEEQSLSG
jgi:diguanylate cyclase